MRFQFTPRQTQNWYSSYGNRKIDCNILC
jgi:hypothetical protein